VQNLPEEAPSMDSSGRRPAVRRLFESERNDIGPGKLSAYYSRYEADSAHYLDGGGKGASQQSGRALSDCPRSGRLGPSKVCGKTGRVGGEQTRAWAVGSVGRIHVWSMLVGVRAIGLQLDLGLRRSTTRMMERSEPSIRCFPNAYYFTLD